MVCGLVVARVVMVVHGLVCGFVPTVGVIACGGGREGEWAAVLSSLQLLLPSHGGSHTNTVHA